MANRIENWDPDSLGPPKLTVAAAEAAAMKVSMSADVGRAPCGDLSGGWNHSLDDIRTHRMRAYC